MTYLNLKKICVWLKKITISFFRFERMVNNNMHCVTLTTQYRMRPEISSLLRTIIYENITDDFSVKVYPDIVGVSKNLYFINHTEPESGSGVSTLKFPKSIVFK